VENLLGGSGHDTFLISDTQSLNLDGGAGDDSFIFLGDAALNGYISGGCGQDTLDFAGSVNSTDIRLTLAGPTGSPVSRQVLRAALPALIRLLAARQITIP
jgi:Ca2+-binding RTX toxin-like protein